MPKVGKRHFPYTEKGKKAAKAHAKKTEQRILDASRKSLKARTEFKGDKKVKKYYGGGKVDPFSTKNPEGVPAE